MRRLAAPLAAAALLACTPASPAPAPAGAADDRRGGGRRHRRGPSARASPIALWVDCVLTLLTLRQKAAQMVWPRAFGDYNARDAAAWKSVVRTIRHDEVGGIIMGVGSPLETAAKLNELQSMSGLPLLVGADFETGAGFRLRGGWFLPNAIDLGGAVNFPPSMALGATGDTALAYAEGRVTAEEGRALGIQVNFAPVLDVNNNPANPVISTRSYGGDPAAVARLGAAYIRGLQDGGMLATGKHFPGHGDTGVNSHLALPVVNGSRARLDSVELVPFRAAVAAGVSAIMTFHGSMPALDSSGVPGTLSHAVLTDLLRDSLKFGGLVVTDAMDMAGVLNTYGGAESVMRAVAAGADIILQPVDAAPAIDARGRGRLLRTLRRGAARPVGAADPGGEAAAGAAEAAPGEPGCGALDRRRLGARGAGAEDRRAVDHGGEGLDAPVAAGEGLARRAGAVDHVRAADRPRRGGGVRLRAEAVVRRTALGVRGGRRSGAELLAAAAVGGFGAGDRHWRLRGAELEGDDASACRRSSWRSCRS